MLSLDFKDPLMASSTNKKQEVGDNNEESQQNTEFDVIYKVNDNPPCYLAIILGFQVKTSYSFTLFSTQN